MKKPVVLVDAPSNLGLRPPAPGAVPGVYKLSGALRDQDLLARLDAHDGGLSSLLAIFPIVMAKQYGMVQLLQPTRRA